MADLARKTGSGFDLLLNPKVNFNLVLGDACSVCCDSPCVCHDGFGRPVYKSYYNANHPLGASDDSGFLCKCMSGDFADPPSTFPATTFDVVGNGVANEHGTGIPAEWYCASPGYYGCSWDGSFAVSCGTSVTWYRAELLCTLTQALWAHFGLGNNGFGVRVYYWYSAGFTVGARAIPGPPYVSLVAPPVASATLSAGFLYQRSNETVLPSTWTTDSTWGGVYASSAHSIVNGSRARHSWTGNYYEFYAWEEATCPQDDCQPTGGIPSCSPVWTARAGFPFEEGNFGCHPSLATVSVTPTT